MRRRPCALALCAALLCVALCDPGLRAAKRQLDGEPKTLPGLVATGSLDPPLVSDLTRLKFSPNGNYILAQDDSSISVLSRQPFALKFRIDAPFAGPAQFTPDSASVTFSTGGPHLKVERWDVAAGTRISAREVVLLGGCVQSLLSPDGQTLACFSERVDEEGPQRLSIRLSIHPSVPLSALDLSMIDVATGDALVTKQNFLAATRENAPFLSLAQTAAVVGTSPVTAMIAAAFSPDSQYFVAAFEKQAIAVDVPARASIPVRGSLEWMLDGGFAFLAPNRLIVANRRSPESSEIVDFPSGAVTDVLTLGDQQMEAATRGDYLFLRPIKAAPVGVFDWKMHAMVAALREPAALDICDPYAVTQAPDGQIVLYDFPAMKTEARLALPPGPLARAASAAISPDLSWLAVSGRSRSAIWNLPQSKQRYSLRGFMGAYFDGSDALYAEVPPLGDAKRSVIRADLSAEKITMAHEIGEQPSEIAQYGRYLLAKIPSSSSENPGAFSLDVRDARDGHTLWTANFPKLTPDDIEISPAENRIVFRWMADKKPAIDQIKKDQVLRARYARIKEHANCFLLQVLDAETGKTQGNVLVEGQGWTHPPHGFVSGEWLFVADGSNGGNEDTSNGTQVYSIATGELKASVASPAISASAAAGLFATKSLERGLQFYSLPGGELRAHLEFPSSILFVRFSADAKRFFVLTSSQQFYIFDAAALGQPNAAIAAHGWVMSTARTYKSNSSAVR